MNRTLRIIRSAALLALFAAVVAGSALAEPMQGKGDEAAAEKSNLSRMADHIEIMRILIAKSINEGPFGERYSNAAETARKQVKQELAEQLKNEKAGAEVTANALRYYAAGNSYNNWSFGNAERPTFTSHTRGFYASGIGVLFTTEVSTPGRVVQRDDAKEPEKPRTQEDDAWQAAAKEAEGRNNPFVREYRLATKSDRVIEIDPAYVDDAINGVIESVAKYGLRIADLPDNESIIVAIRFEGETMGYGFSLRGPSSLSITTTPAPPSEESETATDAELAAAERAVAAAPMSYTLWSSDRGASWGDRQEHVVIAIPKSLMKQFAGGSMSVDEVRNRATITRYSAGSDDDDLPFPSIAPLAR